MGKNLASVKQTFFMCDGGSCRKAGGEQTSRDTRVHLRNSGNWENTHTVKTRCNGRCEDAPTWIVQPGNFWYKGVDSARGIEIIKSHVENNEPLKEGLLFEEGALKVDSDNEKSTSFIKPFEYKEFSNGSMGWITKGLSSDQYLYALFSKWIEIQGEGTYTGQNGHEFSLSKLATVDYTDEFNIELHFGTDKEKLLIGVLGVKDETDRQLLKVRGTFYFKEENTAKRGVIFKNKMGGVIASLTFEDDAFWAYCEAVQLGGITANKSV